MVLANYTDRFEPPKLSVHRSVGVKEFYETNFINGSYAIQASSQIQQGEGLQVINLSVMYLEPLAQ